MLNKSNKNQAPMETFLVGTVTGSVASGNMAAAGNSLPISNGQLGIVSVDPDSTVPPGTFITAGDTSSVVRAVEIVQGTPNSSNLSNVNAFGIGHKALVRSGIIRKDKIRSIATYKYELPQYSVWYLTGVSGLATSTRYYVNLTMEGERIDTTHGMNREVIREVVKTPSTAFGSNALAADFVLQNLGLSINKLSKFVNPNTGFAGTKPIIAFGVKSDAVGEADDIGDITTTSGITTALLASKAFARYTVAGTTHTCEYTPDIEFVNSLNKAIGSVPAIGTAKIIELGSVTPGTAATIDGLLIVALRETPIAAYDDVKEQSIRLDVNFGSEFGTTQPTYTLNHVCKPFEGTNSGRQLDLRYKDRAAQMIFNLQNWPVDGKPYPVPESYINPATNYQVTVIEYYDTDNKIVNDTESVAFLYICVPVTIASTTVKAEVGFTINTTTISGLEESVGVWLRSNAGIEYKGQADSTTVFS
jgi:hypothetical protein